MKSLLLLLFCGVNTAMPAAAAPPNLVLIYADELYREVKSETAKDGLTVREVTISLFEQWLRQKKQPSPHAAAIDWENFQAPLSHLVPAEMTDHSTEAMRKSAFTGQPVDFAPE